MEVIFWLMDTHQICQDKEGYTGVARGPKGPPPTKFLPYLFVLCFEWWCLKANTVAGLKSTYLASPKSVAWLRLRKGEQ